MNRNNQNTNPSAHSASSRMKRRLAVTACLAGLMTSFGATAGLINVPNGDFSLPANAGSIGGGILTPIGVDVAIGSAGTPWTGTFTGILAVLAPPTLTIDAVAQTANIQGLIGINVGGLLSNSGYFSQVLSGTPWIPNKRYTVWTDIDVGRPIGLDVLGAANVGIALRSGLNVLSASTTAAAPLVTLDLLHDTDYRLKLVYDTGATVNGNVGLELFNLPEGLLTVDLLASTTFPYAPTIFETVTR
ncbi:MAG: hypothetical protein ABIR62_00530 [Dokdonella sp.]|uniref:hypothetical protein n=1 Tax=Dokdonella sp. TaxID=2291710 RepID=UPI00326458A3